MKKCRGLVTAGAKFRGTAKALAKSGTVPDLQVPENPIDLSFPLSYVASIGAVAKSINSKIPSEEMQRLSDASDAFVERKSPALKNLTDRVEVESQTEAAARLIVYANVLRERSRRGGRVI